LSKTPNDRGLLNDIFRGFHTIKGGAGFLNAAELVTLCHLTENLFDKLRNGELAITPSDGRHPDATGIVRDMFGASSAACCRGRPTRLLDACARRRCPAGELDAASASPPAPAKVIHTHVQATEHRLPAAGRTRLGCVAAVAGRL
jgi:two-component system chemotaxis sensor kinase CheA